MTARLLVALFVVSVATAYAQSCLHSVTVTASGIGAVEHVNGERLRSAVSDALANALASATGAYVQQKTTLTNALTTTLRNGTQGVSSKTTLEQVIEQRLSGSVLRLRILSSTVDANQLEHVTVRATICTDKRVALALQGEPDIVRVLAGDVRRDTTALGWALVADTHSVTSNSDQSITEEALRTGASILVVGQLQVGAAVSGVTTKAVAATLNVALINARSFEVLDTISVTRNGIGFTQEAAVEDALSKISNELTRQLTTRFLTGPHRPVAIILVHGIQRSNDRFTLQDLLSQVPGVLQVTSTTYLAATDSVRLEASISTGLCAVAHGLANSQRRIMLEVDSCGSSSAELTSVGP